MAATCSTERWTFNSLGQTPCQVATAVGRNCGSDAFVLAPLSGPNSYSGPGQASQLTHCQCNTVIYNLIMACSVCQSGGIIDWMEYSSLCVETAGVYNGYVPGGIPSGVAVPAWAFTSPLKPPYQFDIAIAKAATGPDSSSQAAPVRTSSTSTLGASFATSPTESSTTTAEGPPKSSVGRTTDSDATSTTSVLAGAIIGSSSTTDTQQTGSAATISNLDGGFMTLSDPPGSQTTSEGPQGSGNVGDPGSASQERGGRNIAPIIGAAVGGAVALGLLVSFALLIRRRRARSKETFPLTMSEAGTYPSSSSLQPFSIPREPPHYFSGYVPSEASESEYPPAYATEDGGLVLSGDGLESGQARRLPLHGQSKLTRDLHHGVPVHAFSPVHKALSRR